MVGPMTQHSTNFTWKVVGGACGAIVLAWVTLNFIQALAFEKQEFTVDITEEVRALDIKTENGKVTVIADRQSGAWIEGKGARSFWETKHSEKVMAGGELNIRANCPGWGFANCHMNYVVHVPVNTEIVTRSSNGDIRISDATGNVNAHTSNGDIDVINVTGSVKLRSSNGNIDGLDLRASVAEAETSNGDIRLAFNGEPVRMDVESSNGEIDIRLPRNEVRYNVDAKTSNGEVTNAIGTDSFSDRLIKARTSNGDIDLRHLN